MTRQKKSCRCSQSKYTTRQQNSRGSKMRNKSGQTTKRQNSGRSRTRNRSGHMTKRQNSKESRTRNRNGHRSKHRSGHNTRRQKKKEFRTRRKRKSNRSTKFCKRLFCFSRAFDLFLYHFFLRVRDYLTKIVHHTWLGGQIQVSDICKVWGPFFKIPNSRDVKAKSSKGLVS